MSVINSMHRICVLMVIFSGSNAIHLIARKQRHIVPPILRSTLNKLRFEINSVPVDGLAPSAINGCSADYQVMLSCWDIDILWYLWRHYSQQGLEISHELCVNVRQQIWVSHNHSSTILPFLVNSNFWVWDKFFIPRLVPRIREFMYI